MQIPINLTKASNQATKESPQEPCTYSHDATNAFNLSGTLSETKDINSDQRCLSLFPY